MNQVINQFTTRAETYSASANWISNADLLQSHLDASGRKAPGHVLELCCGTGMVGRTFQKAGWHVCGIDLTRQMAEEANLHYPCICSSAENIPYLDKSFDVVVLRQAYFLLDDGQKVLAEARRVLKDGGVFVFSQTVPYSDGDHQWLEKIHRYKQAQLREFYSEQTLVAELKKAGFAVEETIRLSVRENINHWMANAPEQSEEKKAEVCRMVAEAPEPYRSLHRVEVVDGQVFEDWNWVVFRAGKTA